MGQGTDLPFLEAGSEPVTLNKSNYLTTPRMVASRVNELNNSVTSASSGQRSLNMTLTLESSDPNLSPVIDLQRMSAVFISNRVDAPITNSDAAGFKSGELDFNEYEFNMEDLPPFKYYRIKLLLTSTNQVYVPRIQNLRVITLA